MCAPLPLSHALAALAGLPVETIVFAAVAEPTAAGPSGAVGAFELAFDLVQIVLQVDVELYGLHVAAALPVVEVPVLVWGVNVLVVGQQGGLDASALAESALH